MTSLNRKILTDGVITDQEVLESETEYFACFTEAGLKVTKKEGTQYEMTPLPGVEISKEEDRALTDRCENGGFAVVGGVYDSSRLNPDKKNPVQMMLKCLKKRGVVEEGVALKEFDPMYEDWDYMDAHRADFDACYADPNFYNQ